MHDSQVYGRVPICFRFPSGPVSVRRDTVTLMFPLTLQRGQNSIETFLSTAISSSFCRIVEMRDSTSLLNAGGVLCRRCDMRSSDLMGDHYGRFFLSFNSPLAKSWSERKLSSSDGAGTSFSFSPPRQLICELGKTWQMFPMSDRERSCPIFRSICWKIELFPDKNIFIYALWASNFFSAERTYQTAFRTALKVFTL